MAYEYKNSKGTTYYLHSRPAGKSGKGKLYFFSKEQKDALDEVPEQYKVIENERTGLPILKKKDK